MGKVVPRGQPHRDILTLISPPSSAEQLRAFAHQTAELESTRQRARALGRAMCARLPGAPNRRPGGAVLPSTAATQGWRPTSAVTSQAAEGNGLPLNANVASESQALPSASGSMWQTGRVPYRDDPDREVAARRSRETFTPFNLRWGGYLAVYHTAQPGLVDVHTLQITAYGKMGPAKPGLEPVHTMTQNFRAAANFRMYRLDKISRVVASGDARRIVQYVQQCRGIRPTMKRFDGIDPAQLLPFLKDLLNTFKAQHLTNGVAVWVLANYLERDAERLYSSYAMRGLRAGQLHEDVGWPGLANQLLKRYLTDEVLGEAYDAVPTARQQPHETENTLRTGWKLPRSGAR